MIRRLSILLILALPIPCRAQVATDTGQRVRVHYGLKKQAIGVLGSIGSENLEVRDTARNRTVLIPRSDITLIERSLGKRRDFFGNLFMTVIASSFATALVMAATQSECEGGSGECFYAPDGEGAFVVGLGTGALIGIPLGSFIGAIRLVEYWTPLTSGLESRHTLSISPILGPRIGFVGTLR